MRNIDAFISVILNTNIDLSGLVEHVAIGVKVTRWAQDIPGSFVNIPDSHAAPVPVRGRVGTSRRTVPMRYQRNNSGVMRCRATMCGTRCVMLTSSGLKTR